MGESANVRGLATLFEIRQAIRASRRAQELTLDGLSEKAGVDRAAIHKIESAKKYPDYEPGLDTFKKIVEAMKMSLAEFFARLEGTAAPPRGDSEDAIVARFVDAVGRMIDARVRPVDVPSGAQIVVLPATLPGETKDLIRDLVAAHLRGEETPLPSAQPKHDAPATTSEEHRQVK